MGRDDVLAPRAIEALIAQGQTIVIYDDMVLRLDSWLEKHPGGRLAIMHMVGRDASNEMKAYHSAATLKTMAAFRIGRKQGHWINHAPPIRGGVFRREDEQEAGDTDEALSLASGTDDEGTGTASTAASSVPSTPDHVEVDVDIDARSHLSSECYCEDQDLPHKADPSLGIGSFQNPDDHSSDLRFRFRRPSPATTRSTSTSPPDSCKTCMGTLPDKRPSAANDTQGPGSARELDRAAASVKIADAAVLQEMVRESRNYPPIDQATQQEITRKYQELHQRVKDAGLYNCPYSSYAKEMARYTFLFAAFVATLQHGWYMTSAAFLGVFWHQIMFTAHDAGHRAITHCFEIDTLIGLFIADFCCGLSIGWWKSSHNVHHLVTNAPEHDPDIQNVPFFSTCTTFFKSIHSTYYGFTYVWDAVADFLVPFQAYTYYPVMAVARFNLHALSWLHVLSVSSNRSSSSSGLGGSKAWWIRPTEIVFMACYWFLFGYCLVWRTLPTWTIRVAFVVISHMVTMPLHVQITLSHWGMSTVELGDGESFPQRQLRMTLDVDCPEWLDFIHGGLQFQAVHHLFPRVPRHNLRKVQAMVREFCADTGIPYSILSFTDGNKKVLGRLSEVSDQFKVLVECQKHMAATGESGLH